MIVIPAILEHITQLVDSIMYSYFKLSSIQNGSRPYIKIVNKFIHTLTLSIINKILIMALTA